MSVGNSGRIVIEVEPILKRHLYSTLAKDGICLKEWFISEAIKHLRKNSNLPPQFEKDFKETGNINDVR